MVCPCCVGESYCCWDKDPRKPLEIGEPAAQVSCQDTPCPGMNDPFPDDTLRRGGPFANGTECAAVCKANQCGGGFGNSGMTGPVFGIYQGRVVEGGANNPASRYYYTTYRVGPDVSNVALFYGYIPEPGSLLSPLRWMVYATGEEDGFGNVIRYRELLIDTGWIGVNPRDDCEPPFPQIDSQTSAVSQANFEAIDRSRCFEVVVFCPCFLTRWYFQLLVRIL